MGREDAVSDQRRSLIPHRVSTFRLKLFLREKGDENKGEEKRIGGHTMGWIWVGSSSR